jgi:LacI family transcriptional regulator
MTSTTNNKAHPLKPLRVAAVWQSNELQSRRILEGVCRQAELIPGLLIEIFDLSPSARELRTLAAVRRWKPDGIVLEYCNIKRVKLLRMAMPDVPIVSVGAMPPDLVNTVVAADAAAALRAACEHFRGQGVRNIALCCAGNAYTATMMTKLFRAQEPEGVVRVQELPEVAKRRTPVLGRLPQLEQWLRSLPKPVGIISMEFHVTPYLCGLCGLLQLRVPEAVQFIGPDAADVCMGCTPHISSISIPGELIGEKAMEVLGQYLLHADPPPPPIVRVGEVHIIARGSTGPVKAPANRVAKALSLIGSGNARGITAGRIVGLSKQGSINAFYKEFRQATGATPGKLLRRTRVEQACRQLAETEAPIVAIAASCGFSSANYFAQVFREIVGMTPGEYRKSRR